MLRHYIGVGFAVFVVITTIVILNPITNKSLFGQIVRPVFSAVQSVTGTRNSTFSTVDDFLHFHYGAGDYSWNDERLLNHIRSRISRPSPNRPTSLAKPTMKHFSQCGESEFIDKHLKQRTNGFFVECGALDGETYSNSLFFERERNWTGLLIEANPFLYRTILEKNRNVNVLGVCLSGAQIPSTLQFIPSFAMGGLDGKLSQRHFDHINGKNIPKVLVNCFPFNSIMAALGVDHIDYFSLDVEGVEVEILKTIDWKRLKIDILTIEFGSPEKLEQMRKLFNETGLYREVNIIHGLDVTMERIVSP